MVEYKTGLIKGDSSTEIKEDLQRWLDEVSLDGWRFVSITPMYLSNAANSSPEAGFPGLFAKTNLVVLERVKKQ